MSNTVSVVTGPPTTEGPGEAMATAPVPQTPLFNLRQRRLDLAKSLFLPLRVPRWEDPEVWVRYRPIDSVRLEEQLAERTKSKAPDASLNANADILVQACDGIYAKLPDHPGKKLSLNPRDPEGTLTKFDNDLADSLGLDPVDRLTAAAICRKLYQTDGDLVTAASQLLEWSTQESQRIDEDFTSGS